MRTLIWVSALLTLCSCKTEEPPKSKPEPVYDTTPTGTTPDFHGQVPKNIVMISIDSTRIDYLGRYDPAGDHTPFLTALMADGVPLDNHSTCSNWTFAGVSCTLMGRYNIDSGHMPKLTNKGKAPFPDGTPFLATYLKDMGYTSVLSSTNGWLGDEWNNTQGYDASFHPANSTAFGAYVAGRSTLESLVDVNGEDPWFLHIHLIEPHAPYNPPQAYLADLADLEPVPWDLTIKDEHYTAVRDDWGDLTEAEQALLYEHLQVRYRGELSWLDDQLRDIFEDLNNRNMLDDTLMVFWTDHGEQFWDHGHQSHAYNLNQEENAGLAFFWAKNIIPTAWTGPTVSIDLVPTILNLKGLDPLPAELTGIPLGEAPEDRARFAMTVSRLGTAQMVLKEDKRLIFNWNGELSLFDRATDPAEQTNLYSADNPDAQELWDLLEPMVIKAEPLATEYSVKWPTELQDR